MTINRRTIGGDNQPPRSTRAAPLGDAPIVGIVDALTRSIRGVGKRVNEVDLYREVAEGARAHPSVAFADLPAATDRAGWEVFVTDGRKMGEGAGAGTGVMAYCDGSGWYRFSDDTAVAS